MASEIQPFLKPHGWPKAKICKRMRTLIHANWKLVAENSMERYHCGPAHPEFSAVMSYVGALDSKRMAEEREQLTRQWEAHCNAIGYKVGHVDDPTGRWWTVHRLPIQKGYLTQTKSGQPVAPLMGTYKNYDGGITGLQIYPMSFMVPSSDHAYLNRFTPIDADHTELEALWLVRADAEEGHDYDPDQVSWLWRVTGEADVRICEDNPKGVNSRRYEPGRYALIERQVEQFIQRYLYQLQHGVRYEEDDFTERH
jgi:phenylpropionate dioxygenase-like ring-hydroxylating dioxygenase large terminal subunit